MSGSNVSVTNTDEARPAWNQPAVSVSHAFKQYGSKSKPNQVLTNLHMTVAKGTIYGLLGASGCGKTTLLSSLVGRKKLNSGELWVLGGKPGTKGSGVPGKRVGYMPQELALYGEFNIKETMMYFGWIFGMKTDEIMERLQFLSKLLDLPSQNRLVKNLSGGQQRRVSFAVALMHDPELLILDEPTVGLDPLLRQSIWNHLVHITKNGQKTVIITTHYIEEARQAHTIGLMRSGRLLAEESPQALLTRSRCSNLEDVFLKLSRKQDTSNGISELSISNLLAGPAFGNKIDAPVSVNEVSGVGGVVGFNKNQSKEYLITDSIDGSSFGLNGSTSAVGPGVMGIEFDNLSKQVHTSCWSNITSRGKIRALSQKNFLRMWRNVGLMLFMFASPVMQVVLFCLAIGRDPNGLKLAIANMEMNGTECNFEPGCHFRGLSCRYLNHLNQSILREYYSDRESAIEAVKAGQAWGAVYFTRNFSRALVSRLAQGMRVEDETLDQSEIQIWLDMSSQQVGLQLNRDIQLSYRDFARGLLKDCGKNEKLGDTPIQFNVPIYGTNTPTFIDFAAPGVILTVIFFLAVSLTSSSLITERNEGLLDRSWVAGVFPSEIVFSHVITQFVVICGQTALVLISMLMVFGITCNGNIFLVIIITLLQGMCGMCFGFVISAACELEQDAVPLALGSFYPILLLSGVIWPIEGMPLILRYISNCLPATQAVSSLRSILTKGWGLDEPEVYLGFISSLTWIIMFLIITLLIFKVKRRR